MIMFYYFLKHSSWSNTPSFVEQTQWSNVTYSGHTDRQTHIDRRWTPIGCILKSFINVCLFVSLSAWHMHYVLNDSHSLLSLYPIAAWLVQTPKSNRAFWPEALTRATQWIGLYHTSNIPFSYHRTTSTAISHLAVPASITNYTYMHTADPLFPVLAEHRRRAKLPAGYTLSNQHNNRIIHVNSRTIMWLSGLPGLNMHDYLHL